MSEDFVPLSLREGTETPAEWYRRTQKYVDGLHARIQELETAVKKVQQDEREACAQIAEQFGPSRPCYNPKPPYIHRWEGEQAASRAIAHLIRKRSDEPAE